MNTNKHELEGTSAFVCIGVHSWLNLLLPFKQSVFLPCLSVASKLGLKQLVNFVLAEIDQREWPAGDTGDFGF